MTDRAELGVLGDDAKTAGASSPPKAPMACPHCGGAIGIDLVGKAKARSRLTMTLAPEAGALLGAKVLGSKIEALASLLEKAAEVGSGSQVSAFAERVATAEDGSISVTFLIVRVEHEAAEDAMNRAQSAGTPISQP